MHIVNLERIVNIVIDRKEYIGVVGMFWRLIWEWIQERILVVNIDNI